MVVRKRQYSNIRLVVCRRIWLDAEAVVRRRRLVIGGGLVFSRRI